MPMPMPMLVPMPMPVPVPAVAIVPAVIRMVSVSSILQEGHELLRLQNQA